MNEIYWLTRLDQIYCWLTWIWIAIGIAGLMCMLAWFLKSLESNTDNKQFISNIKCCIKKLAIIWVTISFISIFIPTTNDAYAIIGIGGTIDYIKTNDTTKQLPEKCIKAIDLYLDECIKENENE